MVGHFRTPNAQLVHNMYYKGLAQSSPGANEKYPVLTHARAYRDALPASSPFVPGQAIDKLRLEITD